MAGEGLRIVRRLPDWPRRLVDHVAACQRKPFCWGMHDCALWAASTVDAMCGSEIAARFRGRYDSERTAFAFLISQGWASLLDAACECVGQKPMRRVLRASRGDLVWMPAGIISESATGCLGVVGPDGAVLAPGNLGLEHLSLSFLATRSARAVGVGRCPR